MKKGNNYGFFRNYIVFLVIVLLSSSCNILYIPTTHNSPMLSNKDEFQVSALVGVGLNLQTAYAATDHIGLMLNGHLYRSQKEFTTENDNTKKVDEQWMFVELGTGYFTKVFDAFTFELFVGGGAGQVPGDFRHVEYTYDGTQTAHMSKLFLQPAIGISSKVIDFSCASRFSSVTMNNETKFFFEPGLIMKLGYKNFRLIGNLGLSVDMNKSNKPIESSWDYLPFSVGLGLQYSMGRIY